MGYGLIDAHTHLMFASLPQLAMITSDDSSRVQVPIQDPTLNTRNLPDTRQRLNPRTPPAAPSYFPGFGMMTAPSRLCNWRKTSLLLALRHDGCPGPRFVSSGICSSNRASSQFSNRASR
jgi:hypothetical protein